MHVDRRYVLPDTDIVRRATVEATARYLRTVFVAGAVFRFAPHHYGELASIGVALIHLPRLLDMLGADPFPT